MKKSLLVLLSAVVLSLTAYGDIPANLKHSNVATASSNAATLNNVSGTITTESLTTAAAASYTLTLTNARVTASSFVYVVIYNGSNSQGIPVLSTVTPGSSSVVIKIFNLHATQAFNGTLKICYELL